MLEKACIFSYNIFVPDLGSSVSSRFIRDSSIVAFEYSNKERNQIFKECFRLKIPFLKDFHPKHVYLNAVENYTVGLECIVVIVLGENEIAAYMYCQTLRNSLFFMQTIPTPSNQIKKNVNLFVTDGPMVVLLSGKELSIHSICQKTKHSLDLTLYCKNDKFQILQCSGLGQLMVDNFQSVLFISLSFNDECGKNCVVVIVVAVNTENSSAPVFHVSIPLCHFFPEPFHGSVSSLWITNNSMTEFHKWLHSEKYTDKPMMFIFQIFKGNHSYVCTTENFLVFHDRKLVHVCNLPQPDIHWNIKVDSGESPDYPFFVLLISRDQDVYLIKKTPICDKVQVTKSWESIDCILTGFVKADDSKKLLMLRDCSSSSWQEEVIICDVICDFPLDLMNQSDIPPEAIEKTISGIKSNLETGKSAVAEAEWEVSQKIGATLDALYKIKNEIPKENAVAEQILSFQETLLDILIYPDGQSKQNAPIKHSESISLGWKSERVVGRRMVLCWEFTNTDKRPFCHPSIKIFIENQEIDCIQKIFVGQDGHQTKSFVDDEIRQIIYREEKFYVLVNFQISQFLCNPIQIEGVLCGSFGVSRDNVLPLQEEAFCHLQKPLKVSISPSLWEEPKDISQFEDLKYFKIIQHKTVFSLTAFKSHLSDVEASLFPPYHSEFRPLIYLPDNVYYSYSPSTEPRTHSIAQAFVNPSSTLYGVSVVFTKSKKNEYEIETFTSSDQDTFLLVKMMYHNLKTDFLILPTGVTLSEKKEVKQKVISAMKEEVDFLLSAFDINSGIQSSNMEEKNRITRKQFLKMRSFAARKEAITDHIMQNLYKIHSLSTDV